MSHHLMNAAQINQIRIILNDVERRLAVLERPAVVEPPPSVDEFVQGAQAAIDKQLARAKEQLVADLRAEVRSAVSKERAVMETTLSHKCDALVGKLVRERVEQVKVDITQSLQQQQSESAATLRVAPPEAPEAEAPEAEAPDAGAPAVEEIVLVSKEAASAAKRRGAKRSEQ